MRMLAVARALPLTFVGLAIGVMTGVKPVRRQGVLLFANAKGLPGNIIRKAGFAAGTFGHVVICTRDPGPELFAHELEHTRQAERLGLFFAPLYLYLLLRYGYQRHPMEREARAAADALMRRS